MKSSQQILRLRQTLLAHYDAHGRTLPWRVRPEDRAVGVAADPYAVWLSEIMLQQTTVAHATPYWEKFLAEFPTVTDLANADRDRVLTLWAGLGYYARARNLHKCAIAVRDEHDGQFPKTEAQLLKLPGIGPYTAATMAAICFDEATNIVDGNVERVISRLFAVENPLPKAKGEIRDLAGTIAEPKRPGDYGQALMDLGSKTCKPRNPECDICPWSFACDAYQAGTQERYPRKVKKTKLPTRYGAVFWVMDGDKVLIRQRPDKGLLGGMMEFPGTEWGAEQDWLSAAPYAKNWEQLEGRVTHVFTHFKLELTIYRAAHKADAGLGGELWVPVNRLDEYALPSVMQKVVRLVL